MHAGLMASNWSPRPGKQLRRNTRTVSGFGGVGEAVLALAFAEFTCRKYKRSCATRPFGVAS